MTSIPETLNILMASNRAYLLEYHLFLLVPYSLNITANNMETY
jgi:hypothetical protein